ncbi:hypothetical protein TSUD_382570 [Trifolium subterraneum]|uniref:C2 NT-type domain-containing protein n=1 Tax=Trifolium subterraneum TaxID=3900 RepID=A0A2Z6NG59_TRISU|nr:hypothetical protein TSUD_382570 [Trifolium subterraneum]
MAFIISEAAAAHESEDKGMTFDENLLHLFSSTIWILSSAVKEAATSKLEVPKGWDKLFVSVVSVENGKTIAKPSKVAVRNGSCQWSDTFSQSIWVSRDNSSKEIDDCLLKLIVSMGSLRSGILGEVTVCMTSYVSSDAAVPLSIPLNKCNHGTVLNVSPTIVSYSSLLFL